jgi:hypothetical protein
MLSVRCSSVTIQLNDDFGSDHLRAQPKAVAFVVGIIQFSGFQFS